VLNQSSLFIDIIRGHTPEMTFTVNGHEYHMRYYLTNGIYSYWSVFIKGVPLPQQEKIDSSRLLVEAINIEEGYGVCFWRTEEEV
jgi:hypothetical protein